MAKKIDEVWYSYNAKGKKIPPYKSAKAPKRKGLFGRILHAYKQNWMEIQRFLFPKSKIYKKN